MKRDATACDLDGGQSSRRTAELLLSFLVLVVSRAFLPSAPAVMSESSYVRLSERRTRRGNEP